MEKAKTIKTAKETSDYPVYEVRMKASIGETQEFNGRVMKPFWMHCMVDIKPYASGKAHRTSLSKESTLIYTSKKQSGVWGILERNAEYDRIS